MTALRILIVDDEAAIRDQLRLFFERLGHAVTVCGTPSAARAALAAQPVDVAVLDINMPEMDGLQLLAQLRTAHPGLETIMITGKGDSDSVLQAMRLGAFDFFYKPFHLAEIQHAVERTRRFIELHGQLRGTLAQCRRLSEELRQQLGGDIIGDSPAMQAVANLIRRAADAGNTPVLITGPSGTGKELVARAIHHASARGGQYFYPLNCAAIPGNLIESELFGHRKGAFTGAVEDKEGCFAAAHGGTLFLDEISEMPLPLQPRLLRVLEDGRIRRVGDTRERPVDTRVLAATNRDLGDMVRQQQFRLDLLYRLNAMEIALPALAERREDIPLLLDYYGKLFARRLNRPYHPPDDKVIAALCRYEFPGNVRELRNMVERALLVSDGGRVQLNHFSLPHAVSHAAEPVQEFNLAQLTRSTVLAALAAADNNRSRAAELLGISRYALNRKLQQYLP